MPTIKLTQGELNHLRAFYTNELTKATNYAEKIRTILSKLTIKDMSKATNPARITEVSQPSLKRGRKPTVKVEPTDSPELLPLVRKVNASRSMAVKPAIEPAKKHGRKPRVKVDVAQTDAHMPKVRAKSDNGKEDVEPKKALPEISSVVPAKNIAANASPEKPTVTVDPKPKRKRIHNASHKGKVLLAGWNKPLPKK